MRRLSHELKSDREYLALVIGAMVVPVPGWSNKGNSPMDTITDTGTFTAETFVENAAAYNQSAKLRRAFDAVMACGCENVNDTVAHVERIKALLEEQSALGSGYTPDKSAGFGSENGSSIADSLLCRRAGMGAIRAAFAKVGK